MGQSQFSQLASKNDHYLYQWIPASETNGSHSDTWTGFLLYQQDSVPPVALSFNDAWQNYPGIPSSNINGGCYLFCGTKPGDYSTFLDRLMELLNDLNTNENSFAYRYFIWLFNPDATKSDDLLPQCLPFKNGDNPLKGEIVNQTGSSVRKNAISFGNIYMVLPGEIRIEADPATNTISFKQFNTEIQLWNSNGSKNFGVISDKVVLSFDNDSGTLRFNATFSTKSINGNDFIWMNAGVRYFIKNGETDSS